ncbi:MAG TPA: EVE domain-containing protein [Ktedonobacteraceae bacterium]|jgi:hypothetical protein|nr:EVE domain-containing protein [Ktedonobacteraceae bacterium]
MAETHFWLGVVSYEHVQRGVESGFAQLNHGKRPPLARMHEGDWLIYYSPRTSYPSGTPMQAFTAIGQITSAASYQVTLSADFQPFRHTVRYLSCRQVPIQEVLADLTFLPDKQHWGARFRFGHLAVPRADFLLLARAMGVDVAELGEDVDATLSF